MTCPVCQAPMLKSQRHPDQDAPSRIRCVTCRFQIIFRGLVRQEKPL